jgi:hypothetical protein
VCMGCMMTHRPSSSQSADSTALPESIVLYHLHPELVDPPNAGPDPTSDERSAMICDTCNRCVFLVLIFSFVIHQTVND